MEEDEKLRDLLDKSATTFQGNSELTMFSLNDTIVMLENRNPKWKEHDLSVLIFIWSASGFLEDHADEVCKEKCPEFMPLLIEYREKKTIRNVKLTENFGLLALDWITETCIDAPTFERFGSAPVRNAFFQIKEE